MADDPLGAAPALARLALAQERLVARQGPEADRRVGHARQVGRAGPAPAGQLARPGDRIFENGVVVAEEPARHHAGLVRAGVQASAERRQRRPDTPAPMALGLAADRAPGQREQAVAENVMRGRGLAGQLRQ